MSGVDLGWVVGSAGFPLFFSAGKGPIREDLVAKNNDFGMSLGTAFGVGLAAVSSAPSDGVMD